LLTLNKPEINTTPEQRQPRPTGNVSQTRWIQLRERRVWWLGFHALLGLLTILFVLATVGRLRHKEVAQGNADFAIFYTGALVFRQYGPTRLYDLELQEQLQREVLGESYFYSGLLPFNHPPFELLIFLPLSYLPYKAAFLLWVSLNGLSLLAIPALAAQAAPGEFKKRTWTPLLAASSFYPFLVCLWQGQVSILLFWLLSFVWLALSRKKERLAGAVLGLAFIKFHIVYLLAVLFVLKGRWKALLGLAGSLAVLSALSGWALGITGLKAYWNLLFRMSTVENQLGISVERMQNWAGQLYLLGLRKAHSPSGSILLMGVAVLLLVLLWRGTWKRDESNFNLRFAGTLLLGVIAAPHLYIHDLCITFLSLLICSNSLRKVENWKQHALLIILALAPLILVFSLPVALDTGIQLNVILFTSLLIVIYCLTVQRNVPGGHSELAA
jgi:Glycosyltransferase family 87